jgi:glycopeptide antibiotics resistance protein
MLFFGEGHSNRTQMDHSLRAPRWGGALLDTVWRVKHPTRAALLLCFVTSLVIEVLQAYIPVRYSGTTDLITNTCGGTVGAMVYQFLVRKYLPRQETPIQPV